MQRSGAITPILVDSSTAIKMTIGGSMYRERDIMSRSDYWHKIKVLGGAAFDKEIVLKAVLRAVEPEDMLPVKYETYGNDAFFLVKNCDPALDRLCRSSLIVKTARGEPLVLLLTLAHASIYDIKINFQPLLLAALTKRYDPITKTLDLKRFHDEVEIAKTVFCPLTLLRTFRYILELAVSDVPNFEYLNLQHNELMDLTALESGKLSFVKCLDLRNNFLMNMDVLVSIRRGRLDIKKLWLDGNPLCENYSNSEQYVTSVKKYCPNCMELDGVYIGTIEIPSIYSGCHKNERNEEIIKQFINHFFMLYDYDDRLSLKGLYHEDAFYSMSLGMPAPVAHKRRLVQYTACRNLLRSNKFEKKILHLHRGEDNILLELKKLPLSYHDPNTFQYDVMYDDGKQLVFSVHGLFKSLHNEPQVLSFCRTFILIPFEDHEYKILNDQYLVNTPPEGVTNDMIRAKASNEDFIPSYFSPKEKEEIYNKFQVLSKLNEEWCNTFLDEAHWDLRKAITNFVKDLRCSSVPSDAFRTEYIK